MDRSLLCEEQVRTIQRQVTVNFIGRNLMITLDTVLAASIHQHTGTCYGNPNFRFVKADICDREAVDKLFEEEHPDIVDRKSVV